MKLLSEGRKLLHLGKRGHPIVIDEDHKHPCLNQQYLIYEIIKHTICIKTGPDRGCMLVKLVTSLLIYQPFS